MGYKMIVWRGASATVLGAFSSAGASFYFFDYCYFYRDTQPGPLRKRESWGRTSGRSERGVLKLLFEFKTKDIYI